MYLNKIVLSIYYYCSSMSQQRFLPEERFAIPRDGGELIYYRYGPVSDSNKNILAIHGISSSNRMWQCFARVKYIIFQ